MSGLADLPWWRDAMLNLRELEAAHGAEARRRARVHGTVYRGRRAAMVVDVVASRQRRYEQRVLPMVARFESEYPAARLAELAALADLPGYGLRAGEFETMRSVAAGLARYADLHRLDDDRAVRRWARDASVFVHAAKLEPWVGSVSGMGPALLAYLRMRSGADAVKPDLRVRDSLVRLGFEVSADPHSLIVVAHAAAAELGIPVLVLDQLLWWTGG